MADKDVKIVLKMQDATAAGARSAKQNIDKLGNEAQQAGQKLKQMGHAGAAAMAEVSIGARTAGSAVTGMVGQLSQAHIAIIAMVAAVAPLAVALGAIYKIMDKGREEWANQALANAQVAAVWKSMGRSMPIEELNQLAAAMQKNSTFGDDMVLQGAKMLATFPRITDELLPKAIQTMVDFASFNKSSGMTLQAAASAIGKVSMGRFGEVERTGITFEENTKKLDDFNMALDDMNRQLGGQAAATVSNFSGKLEQLGKYWGDFLEGIGQLQDQPLMEFFEVLRQEFEMLTEELVAWLETDDAKELMENWTVAANVLGNAVADIIDDIVEVAKKWGKSIAAMKKEDIVKWADGVASAIKGIVGTVITLCRWFGTIYKWMLLLNPASQTLTASLALMTRGGAGTKKPFGDIIEGAKETEKTIKTLKQEADQISADGGIAGALGGGPVSAGGMLSNIKDAGKDFRTFMQGIKADIKDLNKDDYSGFGQQAQVVIDHVKGKLGELASTTVNTAGESSGKLDELKGKFGELQQGGVNALRGLASQATTYLKQIENEIKRLEDRIEKIKQKTQADIAGLEQSEKDATRKLQRATMTEEQKLGESIDYITTQTQLAKQKAAAGTVEGYKEAQNILKTVNQEAQQLTQYQKIFDSAGDVQWGRDWGTGIVQQTSDMMKQYRQAQGDLEAGEFEKEKSALEERKKGYEDIRNNIQKAMDDAGAIKLELAVDQESFNASLQEALKEVDGQTVQLFAELKGLDEQISAAAQKFNELTKGGWGGPVGGTVEGATDEYKNTRRPSDNPDQEAAETMNAVADKFQALEIPDTINIHVTKQEGLGVSVNSSGNVNDQG